MTPLSFMVTEAHDRNLEFHAWLNLNRATFRRATSVTPDHISNRKPEWILTYDGQKLLNFGIPEVRDYITNVGTWILSKIMTLMASILTTISILIKLQDRRFERH